MGYYEKVLLKAYPHLTGIIGDMDRLVRKKAFTSHASCYGCLKLSEGILSIMDKKERLIGLKLRLDGILKNYTVEEKWLLENRYFRRSECLKTLLSEVRVDFSLRTYYRKQQRVFAKFCKSLDFRGMCESWFIDNYFDIEWLKSLYYRVKRAHCDKRAA